MSSGPHARPIDGPRHGLGRVFGPSPRPDLTARPDRPYLRRAPGLEVAGAELVAGLVAEGSPATLDELARLIGTDPDIALMVTAVTEALQRLGVETLTQIEDHNMPAAATATARVEAWDHDRFLEACFDRGIGNARQLEEYANARQAEGDKPMIRRSAQRYLDGDADPFCGSPGRYPAAARLARVLDVDLRWLLGLTDVRGVYCA